MILLLSICILIACEKANEPQSTDTDNIIGYWINPVVTDTIWKFERASSLKDNDYGFSFKSGQLFVERKNVGWCGTPPITYGDFDGAWSKDDSIINISVDYLGGIADYQWELVAVDNNNLTFYKMSEEYHIEY